MEQGLSSRVLARAPPDQHLLRAAVINNVVNKRGLHAFQGGEPVLTTSLWDMLYADDVGVMEVIVVVCAAFGLTVSETKTEITRLRTKGMPESIAIFSVEAADQVYNQTKEFVYLGANINHNADLFIEVNRRTRNAWSSFRKYTLEL